MGGNAFKNLDIQRVSRDDIPKVLLDISNSTSIPLSYLETNLMGSCGKQETSGDIDIALNNTNLAFYGVEDKPTFTLKKLLLELRSCLPETQLSTSTLKSGQIQTAWRLGEHFVQVDFVEGDADWLKFSHYSPGLDFSPYPGVLMSSWYGVLAKSLVDYRIKKDDVTIGKVSLVFDIEKGLMRKWKLQKGNTPRLSYVDADVFESKFVCPRFTRFTELNVDNVLSILFSPTVTFNDVDSFDKLVETTKKYHEDKFPSIVLKYWEMLSRSSFKKSFDKMEEFELWQELLDVAGKNQIGRV